MPRIAAFITALLLVALGVVAAPTASAEPLPANYVVGAAIDALSFDLDVEDGLDLADVRLISTQSASGSVLTPRSRSVASDLAVDVDGLELDVNSNEQTAPPNQGAPATETLAAASVPGLLSVGALDTSVEARYATDDSCVPGDLLADSQIESTVGASVEPSDLPSVLTTGSVSTRGVTELVPTSGLNRAVRATASGTLPAASFLGGEVEVTVDGRSDLVATATGIDGGATIDYNSGTVTVTEGGTDTIVPLGTSPTFDVASGSVTITANTATLVEQANGEQALGRVAVLTADVRVGPVGAVQATARVDLLLLQVSAIAPPGGIDCPPAAVPTLADPADGSTTEDRTPTYAGRGWPGASINLTIDGVTVDDVVDVDEDGNWGFTPTTPLALGDHTASATQDVAGATSGQSNENTFTVVDLTPPAPVITEPTEDSTTADSTPDIVGTGEPGATVTASVDGAEIGDAVVDGDGNWTVPVTTALAAGPHTASAIQTNEAGNESAADEVDFVVEDTVAPDAPAITQPTEGSTTDSTPDIVGTGEPLATVTVSVDGAEIGDGVVDEDGSWTVPVSTALAPGPHAASAIQTDEASNESAADEVDFVVEDTVAPDAPVITEPTEGSTTDSTPDVVGTGEPLATVTVSVDGAEIGDAVVDEDGNWTVPVTIPLADGSHTASAIQTDEAGNESAAAEVDFVVDDEAPGAPVISTPAEGSTTTDSTPDIVGTGEPAATVTVSVDGAEIGDAVVDEDGNWTVPVTAPLADGSHTASAIQTDEAGNESAADEVDFVVEDTVAPDAPEITAPADGSTIPEPTPNIVGTGEPGATVTVSIDGAEIGDAVVDEDGNWTVPVTTPLADGPHTASAIQTDLAGNESEADESEFVVDDEAPDAPVITAPAEGSTTSDSTPDIVGTGEPGATITVFIDGVLVGDAEVDEYGNWTVPVTTQLANGPHSVSAVLEDSAGNESEVAVADFTVAAPDGVETDTENAVDDGPGSAGHDPLAGTGGPAVGASILGLLCLVAGGALVLTRSRRRRTRR